MCSATIHSTNSAREPRPPVLRVVRPARYLLATAGFYTRALGLEVLESFTDQDVVRTATANAFAGLRTSSVSISAALNPRARSAGRKSVNSTS